EFTKRPTGEGSKILASKILASKIQKGISSETFSPDTTRYVKIDTLQQPFHYATFIPISFPLTKLFVSVSVKQNFA
ncbi:MAG: hypothetical protein AB1589_17655, partial [Cyanobacteriota bacterium]